ncbi:MAG: hypothetical protein A2Y23_01305 [Clostridiales bacterium GWB2_37_7]|nr:MAG: hypothetical protein A2Y23_01305 [Clostridiales bacterium GWB2_37_7]
MKSKSIIFILVLVVYSVSCTAQYKELNTSNYNNKVVAAPEESISNEVIMRNYISDFLTKGYSEHYVVNSIESQFIKQKEASDELEAIIYTEMVICNPSKDPDTVAYIKDIKDKAYQETNIDKKHRLHQEYLTLYSEYLMPTSNNFPFMLTAKLRNGKIEVESIQLFIEIDAENGVRYEPAEGILPKS